MADACCRRHSISRTVRVLRMLVQHLYGCFAFSVAQSCISVAQSTLSVHTHTAIKTRARGAVVLSVGTNGTSLVFLHASHFYFVASKRTRPGRYRYFDHIRVIVDSMPQSQPGHRATRGAGTYSCRIHFAAGLQRVDSRLTRPGRYRYFDNIRVVDSMPPTSSAATRHHRINRRNQP